MNELIKEAIKATNNAYAPYSNFKVGAALLTKKGKVYTGCNIENSSYSITCCAERVAFFKAISEGERDFEAIAIVGGNNSLDEPCLPCGTCRQLMNEFSASDFIIYTVDNKYLLSELLPHAFELEK